MRSARLKAMSNLEAVIKEYMLYSAGKEGAMGLVELFDMFKKVLRDVDKNAFKLVCSQQVYITTRRLYGTLKIESNALDSNLLRQTRQQKENQIVKFANDIKASSSENVEIVQTPIGKSDQCESTIDETPDFNSPDRGA